jgi:hypothetical protein
MSVVVVVGLVGLATACSGDSGNRVAGGSTTTAPTGSPTYARGDSGMFVVDPVPTGWAIDRAYSQDDGSGVYYAEGGDDDAGFWILTSVVDPADPAVVQGRQAIEDGEDGATRVEVDGHDAYRMPLRGDGRIYGEQILWFARPDLVVMVQVPSDGDVDAAVDVEEIAADVHEVSKEVRDGLVRGTNGGGEPGPPIEALRGTVAGDEWVLSAVLPLDYPLDPQDDRRGCAVLTYRDERATTCEGAEGFDALDDASQVLLGGVNFGYGVIGDSSGVVQIRLPERSGIPPLPSVAGVLPEAPELTWFVATFAEVCDRFAQASNGESAIMAAPPGHPHRNDCTS